MAQSVFFFSNYYAKDIHTQSNPTRTTDVIFLSFQLTTIMQLQWILDTLFFCLSWFCAFVFFLSLPSSLQNSLIQTWFSDCIFRSLCTITSIRTTWWSTQPFSISWWTWWWLLRRNATTWCGTFRFRAILSTWCQCFVSYGCPLEEEEEEEEEERYTTVRIYYQRKRPLE